MRTRSATASEIERGLQWTCFHKVKWNIRAVSGWLTVWVLGVCEVELDGRRGRSFRLSADGTGKGTEPNNGRAIPAGTRAIQWGNSPIEG